MKWYKNKKEFCKIGNNIYCILSLRYLIWGLLNVKKWNDIFGKLLVIVF